MLLNARHRRTYSLAHLAGSAYVSLLVMQAVLLAQSGLARSQPATDEDACIACRTEACPRKPNLTRWCGKGKDPLSQPQPTAPAPTPAKIFFLTAIVSTPAGATVQDGAAVLGVTPLRRLKLSRGNHQLIFSAAGHKPLAVDADINRNGQQIEASLSPIPTEERVTIEVDSQPPGATVRMDEKPLAGVTPLPQLPIIRGQHRLHFELEGHQSALLNIEASRDGERFSMNLQPLRQPTNRKALVGGIIGGTLVIGLALGLGLGLGLPPNPPNDIADPMWIKQSQP